jgi:CRP-like cAMP-binding protein
MGLNPEEYKWLHGAVRKVDFLSVLSIGELDKLSEYIYKKIFPKKSVIFKQGDAGDFFYILYKGTASVWSSEKSGAKHLIAQLQPGDYFGEIALIANDLRNSTIICDTDIEAFLLFKNDFNGLVRENPSLEKKIQDVVARRQAQRRAELANPTPTKKGFFSKIFGGE